MLRSNTSAVRGLARRVIPYGVALFIVESKKMPEDFLINNKRASGPSA